MKNKAKNSGSFFIPQRSSGYNLPENVQKLILLEKKYKVKDLEHKIFISNIYLPISLQIEQLKKEILKTNNELFLLSERNNFGRRVFEPERYERYENICFYDCFGILNDTEYLQYLCYSENETDIKTLPKFDFIINYLALIEYYDDLRFDFNEVENGRELPDPKTRHQLQTKLTDSQRGKLFDLLVSNGFISDKDKEGFIWAFGGLNDKYTSFTTEWLKPHNKNLAVYLIDTLCWDKDSPKQTNYLSIMESIFGIKNPRQIRNGYKNNAIAKPYNCNKIDKIISEAQK